MIDKHGTILLSNEALGRRLDISVDELLGKCVYDLLPESLAEERRGLANIQGSNRGISDRKRSEEFKKL